MSTNNSSEIIIDLDNVFDLNRYDENTMLQYMAKEQLEQLLTGFVKNLKKYGEDSSCRQRCDADKRLNDIPRSNNTIFINGQRGTGKTTFLRAMLDYYSNNDEGICPLAFIDPTLIETHQNILVDIVVKFKQLYDERLKYCADEEINRHLNTCLEEMAEGLRIASHHKTNHDKHDDSWFLSQALKSAKSGQYLEERFHHFINAVAKALNKELFIIAIDDVDTHTQKAYDVLETIRRYLNHPRLVVLISGDLRLYNHIVKNKKQNELQSGGKKGNDDKEAVSLVSHLTQQYMTKVFPAYQRIDLRLLLQLFERGNVRFAKSGLIYQGIEGAELNGDNIPPDLLSNIISLSLKIKNSQQKYYRDFILSQPIRTVVQLLKMIPVNPDGKLLKSPELSDTVISALRRLFINEIIGKGVGDSLLGEGGKDVNKIACEIFSLCHRHGDLETGFYLRPDSDDEAYNAVKMYLAMLVSRLLEKNTLSNALTFMLTSAMPANLYMHYLAEKENVGNNLPRAYIEYLGLTRGESVTGVAAHCNPIIFHGNDKKLKQIHGGVINVGRRRSEKFVETRFKRITGWQRKDVISSLDWLSRNLGGIDNYVDVVAAVTILASSSSVQEGAEKRDYISIFSLLAVMARLLDKNSNYSVERFISVLTFGYPAFLDRRKETDDEEGDADSSDDDTQDSENKFIRTLNEKITLWKGMSELTCSSLLMGKIWERVQYTLLSASKDSASSKFSYPGGGEKEDILLGHLFSFFVFGVINAFLIEEVYYSSNTPDELVERFYSAKNTATSPRELVNNINRVVGFINSGANGVKPFLDLLPVTSAIIRCPLVLPFLLPDTNSSSFCKEDKEKISLLKINEEEKADREKLYQAILSTGLLECLYSIEENNAVSEQGTSASATAQKNSTSSGEKYLYISRLPVSGCFITPKKKESSAPARRTSTANSQSGSK
ncbi:P-loop NTPase fold protein [Dickeya sp. Secpp 1600]|uniref:P-loop NTPase fold protein n=1 Tax=Dickeya sp. Secpp 1600 TaxID=2037915 RepID=UPI000D311E2E|nr:P-loop NTPase fold protein [Dickeya sp. Secpp 1600]